MVDCLVSVDHDLIYQNNLAGPKYFGDSCNLDESNCVTGLVCKPIGYEDGVGKCLAI